MLPSAPYHFSQNELYHDTVELIALTVPLQIRERDAEFRTDQLIKVSANATRARRVLLSPAHSRDCTPQYILHHSSSSSPSSALRMYRHFSKQRKLAAKGKQPLLSDEEDDDSSDEENVPQQHTGNIVVQDSADENSDSGADSDSADEDDQDDKMLPASDLEEESDSSDETELLPPPPGFPTAQEAIENPICAQAPTTATEPDAAPADDADTPLICVVCPSKVLKLGKMLEVHLASKVSWSKRFSTFEAIALTLASVSGSQTTTGSVRCPYLVSRI